MASYIITIYKKVSERAKLSTPVAIRQSALRVGIKNLSKIRSVEKIIPDFIYYTLLKGVWEYVVLPWEEGRLNPWSLLT